MIDGSEKRNRQLAFELQNSHVCEKGSNIPLHSITIKYESERNSLMSGFPESTAYVRSYLQYTTQQSMLSVSTRSFHSQLPPPDHLQFKFCQQNH